MASFDQYATKLKPIEGGYVVDSGGPTNRGITLKTFQRWGKDYNGDGKKDVRDLKLLTWADARLIYKTAYWDVLWADRFTNQSIAEIVVDFSVNGWTGLTWLQELVGVTADGLMGPRTLAAINAQSGPLLHAKIYAARAAHYARLIAENPAKYAQYKAGWAARLAKFAYAHSEAGLSIFSLGLLATAGYFLYRNQLKTR